MESKAFELTPTVQKYAWGKKGHSSLVAQCMGRHGDPILDLTPYAELWMGTHPNGPNKIKRDGNTTLLADAIRADPSLLGDAVAARFGGDLPFLFKILSVGQSLSIQAHPDAALAQRLHAEQPSNYPDGNHKPELAIALTEFSGMCGFRPLSEIAYFVNEHAELARVLGEASDEVRLAARMCADDDTGAEAVARRTSAIRVAFRALMTADAELVRSKANALRSRLSSAVFAAAASGTTTSNADEWFLRLCMDYPGDVGCFAVYLLNVVTLAPGQGMFMAANEPHAYLTGECVECMACSDNVVRAGLTPKYKDVETLLSMLTYRHGPEARSIMEPRPSVEDPAHVFVYEPPVAEFAVHSALVPRGERAPLVPVNGPSIVLVVSGHGVLSLNDAKAELDIPVGRGSVVFIGANRAASLRATDASDTTLVAYRALCNPDASS